MHVPCRWPSTMSIKLASSYITHVTFDTGWWKLIWKKSTKRVVLACIESMKTRERWTTWYASVCVCMCVCGVMRVHVCCTRSSAQTYPLAHICYRTFGSRGHVLFTSCTCHSQAAVSLALQGQRRAVVDGFFLDGTSRQHSSSTCHNHKDTANQQKV